jgi:hypothetical protein
MARPKASRFLHWLSLLAILVLPLAPIGYTALRRWQDMEVLFLPGPLAPAHEGLDCKQCHVEAWRGWQKVSGGGRQTGATMEQACARCHGGLLHQSAPMLDAELRQALVVRPQVVAPHHPRQIPREMGNCTDCHQDHQGEKGLLHVTDDQCRRCHANLRTVDGAHTFYASITAFDSDHPPFGWWRQGGLKDPGALRFNHQAHLALDANVLRGIEGPLSRLKRQECEFCHQPDSSGSHMARVRYEKHCVDCHPLAIQLMTQTNDPDLQQAVKAFDQQPAPHVAPDLVLAVLRERLRLLAQQNPMICMDGREPSRPFPGRRKEELTPREVSEWVDSQASSLQRFLHGAPGGCRYCHIGKPEDGHKSRLPEYEPTNISASWFPYAKFSHARHGLMECGACHEQARTSTRTADVLMPSKSKCAECHNDQRGPGMHARTDCLECHRYHGMSNGE